MMFFFGGVILLVYFALVQWFCYDLAMLLMRLMNGQTGKTRNSNTLTNFILLV
jgi:hypothetical protein